VMPRTTMNISQSDWDALWENSEGVQEKMFDENGNRPFKSSSASGWADLKHPTKFPIMKIIPAPWSYS
jgi:hypothetical protein